MRRAVTAMANIVPNAHRTTRRRGVPVLRLLVMIVAKLLVAAAGMHASQGDRPTSRTDIAVGLTLTEAATASERASPLVAVSIAYCAPMTSSSWATLYASTFPTLGFGLGEVAIERLAIPIGLLALVRESRQGRGLGIEGGVGAGLVLSGGSHEGVNLRPFLVAEIGAAVFENGGLRLRYMVVPQGAETMRPIPAYHGLFLVFGATVW